MHNSVTDHVTENDRFYAVENQICGGDSLLVNLMWADSQNTAAIGATVQLETKQTTLTRDVRTNSGYLSGDPSQLHFGFASKDSPQTLIITWPDGKTTTLTGIAANQLVKVERHSK